MNAFQTAFLGFIQGMTEFLPVSSSGHLILIRRLLGISSDCLLFDILLHVGSLGAVVICLRRDIISLFRPPFKRLGLLALATLPAAVVGFFAGGWIDGIFGGGAWLWLTFAATGVLLLLTGVICKRGQSGRVGAKQAAAMGVMQAVALLPGLSRSGSTIFGGVLAGGDREEVTRFSFLMSVPVILGSALLGLLGSGDIVLTVGWWETACGMAAAFGSSLLTIKGMLRLARRANYKILAAYMFGVSLLSLALTLAGI